jgi:hypothetical protein
MWRLAAERWNSKWVQVRYNSAVWGSSTGGAHELKNEHLDIGTDTEVSSGGAQQETRLPKAHIADHVLALSRGSGSGAESGSGRVPA